MTPPRNVAVLVGSLRKASLNRKLAEALIKLSPERLRLEVVEIGQLSLYNQDLEEAGGPQPNGQRFVTRSRVSTPFCLSRRNTIARFPAC